MPTSSSALTPFVNQVVRELISFAIQLSIGERLVFEHHRGSLGRLFLLVLRRADG